MRTFYIFKINNEFTTLTKDYPLNLYKNMESIYYLEKNDFDLAYKMFEKLADPFDKKTINNKIFKNYRQNQNYTKWGNTHMFNNYYTDEESQLTIRNAHLILISTVGNPVFFNDLSDMKDLFVCDFQNKDYFWMDQLLYKIHT